MSPLRRVILALHLAITCIQPADASFESVVRVVGSAALPRDPTPHDVDGDGDMDIFYVDGSETTGKPTEVGWFENTGNGSSWVRRILASGLRGPSSLDVADLDGDGITDLVVGLRLGDGVVWFRGQGEGNFAPVNTIQSPIYRMEDVTVADLNRDNRKDIIISTSSGPQWLRRLSSGGFATPVSIATVSGSFPEQHKCEAHDFDGDGDIDLVFSFASADRLIFCRNNGNGTFATAVNLGIPEAEALDSGDLDGDGLRDVVTAGGGFDDRRVVWFRNLGSGNFSTARVLDPSLQNARSAVIADFDRDGDMDVVVAGYSGPVVWFEQKSPGTFSARKEISQGGDGMRDMVHGDFDGDGDPDLVAAQWDADQFVWYKNTTPPPVIPAPQIISFTADDTSVATSATLRWQVNGATQVEISPQIGVVTGSGNRTLPLDATTTFTLTARNTAGTSTANLAVVVGEAPIIRSFSALDESIARGQNADLLWDVAGAQSLKLLPGPGIVSGNSYRPLISATTTFTLSAANEFGETRADLTVRAGDPPVISTLTATPSTATLNQPVNLSWTSQGADTSFVSGLGEVPVGNSTAVIPPSTRAYTVTVSNEFGSASRSITVTVNGNLLARSPKPLSDSPYEILDVYFADLNGDGLKDLLQTTASSFTNATFSWRPAIAGGTSFGTARILQTSTNRLRVPQAYDMDGDGDLDPIVGGDGPMRWYRNNQNGASFSTAITLIPSSVFRPMAIADFNGDGMPDVAGGISSELRFYPGIAGGGTGTPQIIDDFDGSIDFVETDMADMDGDGDLDLVSGKDFDGEVYWFQNNAGLFTNRFPIYTGGERILGVTARDTDGDLFPEVLIQTGGSSFVLVDGQNGNFQSPVNRTINLSAGIRDYSMVDLDLDGDLDIVVTGRSMIFIENRGGNVFAVKDQFEVPAFVFDPDSMTVGDVDRDGDPDIAVANNDVAVWIENLYRPAARPTAADYRPVIPLAEDFGQQSLPLPPLFADADTATSSLTYSLRSSQGTQILSTISVQAGPPGDPLQSRSERLGQGRHKSHRSCGALRGDRGFLGSSRSPRCAPYGRNSRAARGRCCGHAGASFCRWMVHRSRRGGQPPILPDR
jgi:ketosteroid isomerase-like protein